MSDDGRSSIVVIAMLGNPFSTRWAAARRRGAPATWEDFCAFNVALRHEEQTRWVMTEHGRSAVARRRDHLLIGNNTVVWRAADRLEVHVDERESPWRRPVRGVVRLSPLAPSGPVVTLDPAGRHVWRSHAPLAHVEVDFDVPRVRFRGSAYLDGNQGQGPLEDDFASWSWSRVSSGDRAAIGYDVRLRDGTSHRRGVVLDRDGRARPCEASVLADLGASRFGLPRVMRAERAAGTRAIETVEDGPFYARSVVETSLDGRRTLGMHEVVSLDRFRARWVQALVPFRMRVEAP